MNVDNGNVFPIAAALVAGLRKSSKKFERQCVTWNEDETIANLDQAMIARSVLKRYKQQLKRCAESYYPQLEASCNDIREKLDAYHKGM